VALPATPPSEKGTWRGDRNAVTNWDAGRYAATPPPCRHPAIGVPTPLLGGCSSQPADGSSKRRIIQLIRRSCNENLVLGKSVQTNLFRKIRARFAASIPFLYLPSNCARFSCITANSREDQDVAGRFLEKAKRRIWDD
jgi:hypothetical protein